MKTEEFEAGVMQYIKTTAAGMLEHLQAYKDKGVVVLSCKKKLISCNK